MKVHRWLLATLSLVLLVLLVPACGAPPASGPIAPASKPAAQAIGKRSADVADHCDAEPGKPAPEPLRAEYTGVAKRARCQPEVFAIMGGITHFLGVPCRHCHLEPDYAADTHNKQLANWMARELVPRLQKRTALAGASRDVWCQDCHAGKPKLLGNPRRRDIALEWMMTHLAEDFATNAGKPPKCKDCHGGDLGSPEFRPKILLSDLSGLPAPAAAPAPAPAPVAPPVADEPAAPAAPTPAPSALPLQPIPDFGKR